jgi:hypothetical protein
MRKQCRICWNTANWQEPTGEAARVEGPKSYVHEHGFGHEEWLFNFEWIQPGPTNDGREFKYGFLQPIGKYREKYKDALDVLVYTVTPDRTRVAVAEIKDLFVPNDSELNVAFRFIEAAGWLGEMREELNRLGISSAPLVAPANHVINIRFEPSNVTFFDPRIAFPHTHKTYRINRYQPLDWDDDIPLNNRPPGTSLATEDKRRSEAERMRAAIAGTRYSPRHVKLQNALYDHLCDLYGKAAVRYELSFVDLSLDMPDGVVYFEVKTAPTAKSCIREALGQLLEYSTYPNVRRAAKLAVIGDPESTADDHAYLRYLRQTYQLPIYYRRWVWARRTLLDER